MYKLVKLFVIIALISIASCKSKDDKRNACGYIDGREAVEKSESY